MHLRNAYEAYPASMHRQIEPMLHDLYTDALDDSHHHKAETGSPAAPLPPIEVSVDARRVAGRG